MLFLESKLEYTFSAFDKLNSTFTIWHYKFCICYKFVIVIDLVYAQQLRSKEIAINLCFDVFC